MKLTLALSLSLSSLLLACGGVDPARECRSPSAATGCGGELTGAWEYVDHCAASDPLIDCPGAQVVDRSTFSMRLQFDGTRVRMDGRQRGEVEGRFDPGCFAMTAEQCSSLDYDEGSRRARCQATEGQCRCLTTDDISVHETARYEVFGGFYRLTFGDGTQADFVFCVDGDELLTDGGEEAPWLAMRYRRVGAAVK